MARLNRETSNIALIKNQKSKVSKTQTLLTINIILTIGLYALLLIRGV